MPHPPEEEVSKLFVGECRPEQKPGQWAVVPPLVLEGLEKGEGRGVVGTGEVHAVAALDSYQPALTVGCRAVSRMLGVWPAGQLPVVSAPCRHGSCPEV